MELKETNERRKLTGGARAGRPSRDEAVGAQPAPRAKSVPTDLEELQRRYVNLRARLRSLAYAIQQTERLDGEIEESYKARLDLWRRAETCELTAEEKRQFGRLDGFAWDKWRLRSAWHVAVSSLLLAVFPKEWADQGEPTGSWNKAEGVLELDSEQERDFEMQIPSDFMPFWSRELLNAGLAELDAKRRKEAIRDDGWTISFAPGGGEWIKAPDLPTVRSEAVRPRRRDPDHVDWWDVHLPKPEALCPRCDAKRKVVDGQTFVTKRGKRVLRGKCASCRAKVTRILASY